MPDVSIIMPCFNASAYLAEAVESVRAQSGAPSWELIIADDGSEDSSREIVARFAEVDRRVRLLALPRNGGVAMARNAAIDASDSRIIAFLDADDIWLPEKLRVQIGRMDAAGWRMTYTQFRRFRASDGAVGRLATIPPVMTYKRLLGNTSMATSSIAIERSLLGTHRFPIGVGHEDYALWLEILRGGATAYGITDDLLRYRVGQHSLSSRYGRSASWVWHIQSRRERLSRFRAACYFIEYAARAALKRIG